MDKPTCEQLSEEELPMVFSDADPSWRHGCRMTQVFYRAEDNTYWMARFRRSTDGETDELREGDADITQVEPFSELVTKYKPLA